jgi:hypothetical protein
MKNLSGIKNFTSKTLVISIMVTTAIVGVALFNNAQALTISTVRDCDTNAVMYCGAGSIGTLQHNYNNGVAGHNSGSSIRHIYSYFGISSSDINSMSQYAVAGEVYRDGTVKVNGRVVATDAWTAGRLNISGSTKVTYAGTTFYKRQPRVSFVSSPLAAYVVMKNGVFQFAVLASCGNPVIAHAKPAPVPTHKPTPIPTHKPLPTPTRKPYPTYPPKPTYAPKPTPTCTPTPSSKW